MGDLITMTRNASSPSIRPHGGGDAEILFFTGVRYYRIEDEAPQETKTHSRRRIARAKKDALRPERQV